MIRCAIIACALILAGAAGRPAQAASEIAFGFTSGTAFSLAHYVATEKKYYEAEDLKVDAVMAGAAVGVLQQLAAGSLNIAQAATDQSLRAILRGAPIRIVGGATANAPFRLVAAKSIKGWSDLRGKTISVGGLTDVTLYFLRVMARKNGLADQDYDLLYGGGTPNRFAQLVSGAVAAAMLTNPVDFSALEQGFVDLGSVPQYLPNWAQNNILIDTRWAQQHRALLVAFPARPHPGDEIHLRAGQPRRCHRHPRQVHEDDAAGRDGHLRSLHPPAGDRAARRRCSRTASRPTSTHWSPWATSPRRRRSPALSIASFLAEASERP